MSKNIKQLMSQQFFPWILSNSDIDVRNVSLNAEDLWIIPRTPGESTKEEKEQEKELIRRFSKTKTISTKTIDQYHFRVVSVYEDIFIFICKTDGTQLKTEDTLSFDFAKAEATFLQRMDFISSLEVPSASTIPSRILTEAIRNREAIFEKDLEAYLPDIIFWKTPYLLHQSDQVDVLILQALLNLQKSISPAYEYAEKLTELSLSIPTKEHEWLFDQLNFAITSRKNEYLFLGLYQLLEFFFPFKGISALKERIGYNGSFLQLRAFCSESLGWNVNHSTGAKAAAHLASEKFASICLEQSIPTDTSPEKIEKYKMDAVAKISDLRHLIAHQNFSAKPSNEEDLRLKINALITLLIDAFDSYNCIQKYKNAKSSRF